MFSTVTTYSSLLGFMIQRAATVDAAGDDGELLAVLQWSSDPQIAQGVLEELSRRTLLRPFGEFKPAYRHITRSAHVRVKNRRYTTFWRRLDDINSRLNMDALHRRRPSVTHGQGICQLKCIYGTLHSVSMEALKDSKVLNPLLGDYRSPNLIVPVPNCNGYVLAALAASLRGEFRHLMDVPAETLAEIITVSDSLDLRILVEAVWWELRRRATQIPLQEVPALLAPVRLQQLPGPPNELADILFSLADFVTKFMTPFHNNNP